MDDDIVDYSMTPEETKNEQNEPNILSRKDVFQQPIQRKSEFGHNYVEDTAVKNLLEYHSKLKTSRELTQPRKERSRSPRFKNSVLFLLFSPNKVRDNDIIQELAKYHVKEYPRIVYIFKSEYCQIGRIVKLTFKHTNTISQLMSVNLELKGKPVLLIEPSLEDDEDICITQSLKNHQVNFTLNREVPEQKLHSELSDLGVLAKLEVSYLTGAVTFVKEKSAREAVNQQSKSFEDQGMTVEVRFSKPI